MMINVLLACALTIWLFGGYVDSPNSDPSGAEKRPLNAMRRNEIGK